MKNDFKVMDWVREVRDKQYEETKELSNKELLEFYNNKSKELHQKLRIKEIKKSS